MMNENVNELMFGSLLLILAVIAFASNFFQLSIMLVLFSIYLIIVKHKGGYIE